MWQKAQLTAHTKINTLEKLWQEVAQLCTFISGDLNGKNANLDFRNFFNECVVQTIIFFATVYAKFSSHTQKSKTKCSAHVKVSIATDGLTLTVWMVIFKN